MAPTHSSKLIIFTAFFLLQVWASESAATGTSLMADRHQQWMAEVGRSYKDAAEKARRFKIFKANAAFIDAFNAAGNRSYTLGINEFADLTDEEFLSTRTGLKMGSHSHRNVSSSFMYADVADAPASVDWRTKGAVTDVKNQGRCGKSMT